MGINIATLESTDFNCLYSLNKIQKNQKYLPGSDETFSLTNGLLEINGIWTIVGERKSELSSIKLSYDFTLVNKYLFLILATL